MHSLISQLCFSNTACSAERVGIYPGRKVMSAAVVSVHKEF